MKITKQQLERLEHTLRFAQWFVEDREPCLQVELDQEEVDEAMRVIEEIKLGVSDGL